MRHAISSLVSLGMLACTSTSPIAPPGDVPDASVAPRDVATKPTDAARDQGVTYIDVPVVIDPADGDLDAPATRPDGAASDRPRGDGGPMPNLIPVITNTQVQARTFTSTACEVQEGCTLAGDRRLLRFDLTTPNVGDGDLYLGAPTAAGRPLEMFEWGTCHMHYHLRGYADYRLFDMADREVGRGHKQSFCLLDSARYMSMGVDRPAAERYNCSNQGIHAGWSDVYGRALDCQYIDITGVPAGTYRIRARINVERVVAESNYDDDEAWLTVTIPPTIDGGTSTDPTLACPGEDTGVDRNCGWQVEAPTRTCTPGAAVAVGCNAMCAPPLGTCAGDPMIRVCDGATPCENSHALAQNDDSCAPDGGRNVCSSLTFTCPASGRYTILTGAYRAGGAYECHLETR